MEGAGWGSRRCRSDQLLTGRGNALRLGIGEGAVELGRKDWASAGAGGAWRGGPAHQVGVHLEFRKALLPLRNFCGLGFVNLFIWVGKDICI